MKSILLLAAFLGVVVAKPSLFENIDCNKDACYSAVTSPYRYWTDCASILAKTIAPTVVTATYTSTITRFNNNKFNPTIPTLSVEALSRDKSGMYNISPTSVPAYIGSSCGSTKGTDKEKKQLLERYSSACSCIASAETYTSATATVTAIEYQPTTVSDFNILAILSNGMSTYVFENITHETDAQWLNATYLQLGQSVGNFTSPKAALFALSPDTRLRLESEGKFSMVENHGRLRGFVTSDLELPLPVSFVGQKTTDFQRLGFHITDIHESERSPYFALSVSPFPHSPKNALGDFDSSLTSPINMTVLVTCDWGLCIGTPQWQNETFDAGSMTSRDGRYGLVQLRAMPIF